MKFDYNCIKLIHPTLDDYKKIDWNTILPHTPDDVKVGTLPYYISTFSKLCDMSYDQKNLESCKIFWLFWAVASFHFRDPKSMQKPFSPLMDCGNGSRTPIPEDFTRDDIQFFRDVVPEIQDIFLSSRIYDILWIVSEPRNPDDALKAIDSYLRYPLIKDGFDREKSSDAWLRAKYLSKILREKGKQKYKSIVDTLYKTCSNPTPSQNVHLLSLSELLQEVSSDLTTEQKEIMINRLEECAKLQPPDLIQSYYEEALKWCEISKSQKRDSELRSRLVNIIEQRIEESLSMNPESLGQLNYDLETAIRHLRKIDSDDASKYDTKSRIQKLKELKAESDKEMLKSIGKISVPINLYDFFKESSEKISGKSAQDALIELVTIHPQINVADLREDAKKIMKDCPLMYLFPTIYLDSSSGHKIASTSHPNFGDFGGENSPPAVFAETISQYKILISLIACGGIYPALQTFIREHHVTEYELLQLVHKSPVVLPDRKLIWAKALYYGFEFDFTISTHLLTSQFEHMIRRLLQQNHVITTGMDEDGNEMEKALGTLLKENEKILSNSFGKDMYFELRILLSERIGLNLRNEVAHGLIDSNGFNSPYTLYFWWFALRLVLWPVISPKQIKCEGTKCHHSGG